MARCILTWAPDRFTRRTELCFGLGSIFVPGAGGGLLSGWCLWPSHAVERPRLLARLRCLGFLAARQLTPTHPSALVETEDLFSLIMVTLAYNLFIVMYRWEKLLVQAHVAPTGLELWDPSARGVGDHSACH